ncbi:penicillin-binding protein activator, partial [bacterium]|nr:penicillin-binding protein activator [bacterium]
MQAANSKLKCFRIMLLILPILILQGCMTGSGRQNLDKAINLEQSEPREARHLYLEIIQNKPDTIIAAEAQYRLGLYLLATSTKPSALEHLQKIADRSEFYPWSTAANIELLGLNFADSPETPELIHECIAKLETSATPLITAIKRGWYYSAESAFTLNNWQKVLNSLHAMGTPAHGTYIEYRSFLLQGVSLSKTNHPELAIDYLTKALKHSYSQTSTVLVELMDVLQRSDQAAKAATIALQHPLAFAEQTIQDMFSFLVSNKLTRDEINQLSLNYTTGYGALYLRFEIAKKMQKQGEIEMAREYLHELQRSYPQYHDSLSTMLLEIEEMLQVSYTKIGLLTPLSGPLTSIGHSLYRGAQLAISDYHDAGGTIQFTLVVKDTVNPSTTVVEAFGKLESEDQVLAVIGPVKSNHTKMLIPLCNKKLLPLITPGCPNTQIVSKSSWTFRLFPSSKLEMEQLVRFSVQDLSLMRFGCLYPEIEYGKTAVANLDQLLQEAGADLVYIKEYPEDLSTLRSIIIDLQDTDVDAIIIPDNAERASVVAGQIRYREMLLPTIIGIGAWDESILLEVAGNNLEGSYFISEYPFAHGARQEISNRYSAQFGEKPDAFSMRTYEAVYLVISAVESGVRFRPQLKHWLMSNTGVKGLNGQAWFNSDGNYEPSMTVYRIHGKKYL